MLISGIKWASNRLSAAVQHMGIYHCGADILVTQKLLNRSNIIPIHQNMRCKGMPECMATDRLGNSGQLYS